MMSTSISISSEFQCAICRKSIGTFTCRGCQQNFCMSHAGEHRQMLSIQMDQDIVPLHDQLQQNLVEQMSQSFNHPIIKEIDQWENDSIEKIRQTADNARKESLNHIEKHTQKLKEALDEITKQLKKSRNDDHFFENDLKEWINKLNQLEKDFSSSLPINIQYDKNISSFISNIVINDSTNILNEYFEESLGNINITENNSLIIHNDINNYASVRGKRDYFQGNHRLTFLIERLTDNWIFFGIISANAPQSDYFSIGQTAYGWSGTNNVWRNGVRTSKLNNYISDFLINDKIELFINCDQRTIQMNNERIHQNSILNVDLNYCPLPWKLNLGLYHSPGERIRIIDYIQMK